MEASQPSLEQELIAALLVVLDRRLPGVLQQLLVVLEPGPDPPAMTDNVVWLHGPPEPRLSQRAAFELVERAEQLLAERRAFAEED